ncbi:Sec20-domain-containing protein [Cokeromyces recurvatus]|uniref:Sec20-domain-containing protein n=1 Tax=Cokeromyces recurvatus TaxID=90255 RepID=UPI00221FB928|nr:Sec20-domain-containing protein [Cokeromyces recurvatus]KAI7901805.1 Sec20-domain-containing protein [Cokeromyces recurvatus]
MNTVETKFRSLSRFTAECQRQIERLQHVDSILVQKELAELVKSTIRDLEQETEYIKQIAEEEDTEASKMNILNRLGEYENQLKQLQITSRQAILSSRKRVNDQEKRNREELFGIGNRANGKTFTEQYELKQRGIRKSQHDDALLRASSDVTEALKRTSALMQQELEKSSISAGMLAESSKTLSSTYNEYQNLGSLVHISKRVITQLENSDWFDRLLLLFGLIFFCSVVFYIIKKRTWDVGISWISWLTQRKKNRKIATKIYTVTSSLITTVKTETISKSKERLVTKTTTSLFQSTQTVLLDATATVSPIEFLIETVSPAIVNA